MQTTSILNQDEILSAMSFLYQQIGEIRKYPDKSLFFQNPQIFEGWLMLAKLIQEIVPWEWSEDEKEWEQCTETYFAYLLTMRELWLKYKNLCREYYDHFNDLLDCYGGWLQGDCISDIGVKALLDDKYGEDLGLAKDPHQFYAQLNISSLQVRSDTHSFLSDMRIMYYAVMSRGAKILVDLNPTDDNFAKAINKDLKEWTKHFGKDMFREMKEDLNRHYKAHRTDHNTIELWSDLLDADEDALNKAKVQQLAECDEPKQEHWGEDMKKQMDENGRLMQQILSSCHTEELLDLGITENMRPFIELLTPDNLPMFYEIIVRRRLIQCEMFPELKTQHEDWLNKTKEQPEEIEGGLSTARQSKLDDIIGILKNGNWKLPATADNIEVLLNAVFGKDISLYDEDDANQCEKMWALIEGGRGDRKLIISANLAGFFSEENLLTGTPKEISNDLFGNDNLINSINDGKRNNRSNAFDDVISFIIKYINKIIRQV